MKILLDHNLDHRLKKYLQGFDVSTTMEQDWADLTNGELLSAADKAAFDVILTADSNIKHQQNLTGRQIAILILRAPNNRLTTHVEMVTDISNALTNLGRSTFVEVFHSDF